MEGQYGGFFDVPTSQEAPEGFVEQSYDGSTEPSMQSQEPQPQPQQYQPEQVAENAPTEVEQNYWQIPENLGSAEQLGWYQDRYAQVIDYLGSSQYQQEAAQQRQQLLDETSQEIEDFKVVYQALKSNPQDYILQYFPEALVQHGINPVLTIEQMGTKIHDQLARQFGDDYRERVNPNEIFNPTSFSATVYATQQQLYQQYNEMNAKNKDIYDNWGQLVSEGKFSTQNPATEIQQANEPTPEWMAAQYDQHFAGHGFSEEEYVSFVDAAKDYRMDITDVHKVVHFSDYLSEAYRQGMSEGQKAFYGRMNNTGNATRQSYQPVKYGDHLQGAQQGDWSEADEIQRQMATFAKGGMFSY